MTREIALGKNLAMTETEKYGHKKTLHF